MNLHEYDLPLQPTKRDEFSLNQSGNSFEKDISPIGICANRDYSPLNCYDLPQQINSLFGKQKEK